MRKRSSNPIPNLAWLSCAIALVAITIGLTPSTSAAPANPTPDIHRGQKHIETVVMPRAGRLTYIAVTVFQQGKADAPLRVSVARLNARNKPEAVIASRTVQAADVSWSPAQIRVCVGSVVKKGQKISVQVESNAKLPGYGLLGEEAISAVVIDGTADECLAAPK